MPDNPLVSIIVRTKDRPKLLKRALQSIASQTYRPIEVVLVNDGGCDLDIEEFKPILGDVSHNYINLEKNMGRAHAGNVGIENTKGKYIGFLDDDDEFFSDHVRILQDLCSARGANVAYSAVQSVYCKWADSEKTQYVRLDNSHIYNDDFNPSRLLFENYIPLNALLFSKHALASEKFDESLKINEDWDLLIRLSRRHHFAFTPHVTAEYSLFPKDESRQSPDQIADDRKDIHKQWLKVVFDKHKSLIKGSDWDAFYRGYLIPKHAKEQQFIRDLLVSEQSRLEVELKKRMDELQESNKELSRLNSVISQREEELDRLSTMLNQKDRELDLLSSMLKLKDEELAMIKKMDEELTSPRAMFKHKDRELSRLNSVIRQQDEELARIINSESWKITYPLRQVGKFARFILKGIRYCKRNKPSTVFRRAVVEMYHSPLVGSWLRFFPPFVKQGIKSWLLARETSIPNPEITVTDLKVSIIIPVFNHAEYLDKCIRSALSQDYQNLDIVIVDDFSSDPGVKPILRKYSDNPRVKLLLNEKNIGISETQNRAIINSRGDIIAFLDCDDYLSEDAVSGSLKHWNKSTIYLHTARSNIDRNDKVVQRISFEHLPRADYFSENLERMYATHFKMIRKDAFAKVGLFDPRFDSAQDYDMLMRIAFHYPSSSFVFVPNFVYFHRLHDRQETSRSEDKQSQHTLTIQDEARKRKRISEGIFDKGVSIIMLSYGKCEQTLDAVNSIADTVRIPFEVILFDNGSDSKTVDFLKSGITEDKYPFVKKVFNNENLGPAEGRRRALNYAKGPYYIVFDNDEIAQAGWIEELLVRGETSPDIGAVVSRVFFPDNKLQFSGGGVRYLDSELIDLFRYDANESRFAVSAALFRDCEWVPIGATLFKVNPEPYLHSGYQNLFEDAGVSFALRKQGYRLVNAPGALVMHNHFMYLDRISMKTEYLNARYDRNGMLRAIASFFIENNLIIYDEYVWKENGLNVLSRNELKKKLNDIFDE